MNRKRQEDEWERGRRVEAAFPKRLDAPAIRKLKADLGGATEKEAKADAECAWGKYEEMVACAAYNYANFILVPRLFAKERRQNGDASASPCDYDCRCYVRDWDGVPICAERRPNCKFAGQRRSHNKLANDFTGLNSAWFDARRAIVHLALNDFTPDDPETLAAWLEKIDKELRKESVRWKRLLGKDLPLKNNA